MDGSSDWMFTWYRDGQEVHAGQGVSFDQDATVLSINSASASHCGQYSCSGKHKQRPVSSKITSGPQLDVYGEAKSIIYSFTWFSKGRFHWAAVTVQDVAAGEYRAFKPWVLGVGPVTEKSSVSSNTTSPTHLRNLWIWWWLNLWHTFLPIAFEIKIKTMQLRSSNESQGCGCNVEKATILLHLQEVACCAETQNFQFTGDLLNYTVFCCH